MAEKDLQKQIDEINIKLDAILECATAQKLRSARPDDLMHDLGPVANEVIIDMIRKMHEFEQKGYFEFFTEITGPWTISLHIIPEKMSSCWLIILSLSWIP